MKSIDLFAGTGAFTLVSSKYGITTVFANDIEESSKTIYNKNFGELDNTDINDLNVSDIPEHDLLCGGFPCQPFSIAGQRRGFADERSNVFWKILRILEHHKPSVVLLENVKNLTTHDNGNTFKIIITELEQLGYHIKWKVLDTSKITRIPHHRERIYIVGFRHIEHYNNFNLDFPFKQCKPVADYLEQNIPDKYYYKENLKSFQRIQEGVVKKGVLYQYRRYYVRENKNGLCPTLTANMGAGGHNVPLLIDDIGIRKLTPRECFNLQGFPSTYILPDNISNSKLYKLAGNAVSVPVIKLIIKRIFSVLNRM